MKKVLSKKILLTIFTCSALLIGVGVLSGFEPKSKPIYGSSTNYSISLNTTNKVTNDGEHVIKTAIGNDINFQYDGVKENTSGHTTLLAGGSLQNLDKLNQIVEFKTVFVGKLLYKFGFSQTNWSQDFIAESNTPIKLINGPCYLEIKATEETTITSLEIAYTCQEFASKITPSISITNNGSEFVENRNYTLDVIENLKVTVSEGAHYTVTYSKDNGAISYGNTLPSDAGNNYAMTVTVSEDEVFSSASKSVTYNLIAGGNATNPMPEFDYDITLNPKTEHQFTDVVNKNFPASFTPTPGLAYTLSEDGTYYICSGLDDTYNAEGEIYIAETYNGLPVKEIAGEAFAYRWWVSNIYLPKTITKIGHGAFNGSGVKTVYYDIENLPDLDARNWVFYPDSETESHKQQNIEITFGPHVKRIPGRLFFPQIREPNKTPRVKAVYFDENCQPTEIGDYAFYQLANLTAITLPDSIKTIGRNAFYGTGIKEIRLPVSCESVLDYAFAYSSLEHVEFPNILTTLGENAFNATNISALDLSNTKIKEIPNYCFKECLSLVDVYLPSTLETIRSEAFYQDSNIHALDIPDSVTLIDTRAFYGLTNCKEIKLGKNLIDVYSYAFYELVNLEKLVIRSVAMNDFEAGNQIFTSLGKNVTNLKVYFTTGVTLIPARLFSCSSRSSETPVVYELVIPYTVSSIGRNAFFDMSITHVHYLSSSADYAKVVVGPYNEGLDNVTTY